MRENAVDGESGSAANEARIRIKMYPGERVMQTSELWVVKKSISRRCLQGPLARFTLAIAVARFG